MLDKDTMLNIKHDANSVFTDYSNKSYNFDRDTYTITLDSATGAIMVGFKKPINALFFNHNTAFTAEGVLTLKYYNGVSYEAVEVQDDTFGLMRRGFIRWDRNIDDQVANEVDGVTKYWYKLTSSETRTDMEIAGINLVFADDYELSIEQSSINAEDFLDGNDSHIKNHASARNKIINEFSKKDYGKIDEDGNFQHINVWDLHNIEEVRMASVAKTLSLIYFNASDDKDDINMRKSKDYNSDYKYYIEMARISLDLNDDGKKDNVEINNNTITKIYMSR